ncbi:MAG: TM1266 family iron-only hydrogenase system putative regulator [Christensenellales bacterium]|jgi:putative iron-only hydrogenase system regulator
MSRRIGVVAIVVEDPGRSAAAVNEILSRYAHIIVGRMGLPYEKRGISVISVVVDGSNEEIGAMAGKLGAIAGVQSKSMLTSRVYDD